MLPELEAVEEKYRLLTASLSDPALIADPKRLREASIERAELEPLVRKLVELRRSRKAIQESGDILAESADPEMRAMAEAELQQLEAAAESLER